MKRKFGTEINPSAQGNPLRYLARLALAATVIQAFFRGQAARNRLPWIVAANAFV